MNSFDESDDWFPAVGESDGDFTEEPGHVSEPGDEEGMFFPYVHGHPAMVDDGEDEGDLSGVVNDMDLGQPAPITPVAFLPVQNSISPNTSSSSLETPPRVGLSESGTGRRRLRKKTKAGPNSEFEYFDKKRHVFMKHEILSSYRRLPPKSKRIWNKRLHVLKNRVCQRAKTGKVLELSDGTNWTFPSEIEWIQGQQKFTWHWYCSTAEEERQPPMLRAAAMSSFLSNYHSIAVVRQNHEEHMVKGGTILLTWQGPWGLLTDVQGSHSDRTLDVVSLCARIKADSHQARVIFQDCQKLLDDLVFQHTVNHYAIATELCTKTWKDEGALRVHLHAWVLFHGGPFMMHSLRPFEFRATRPHTSQFIIQSPKGRGHFAGAFYISVDKIGMLEHHATRLPFVDYAVTDRWITSLYSAEKITEDTARRLYAQCVQGASVNIRNLDYVASVLRNYRETKDRLRIEMAIRSQQQPFRQLPEVQQWLSQYDQVKDRYKFLVLDGPSRVGKTRYTVSLTSPEKALCLDCAGAVIPDMRTYDRGTHEIILFDEVHVRTVLTCKKLFQASIDRVSLGSSPTNNSLYYVWCHGAKMVCASNTWARELNDCAPDEQEWLKLNSCYIFVADPLWERCVG